MIDASTTSRHPESAPVVELDVREDLRSGREPFRRIMSVVADLHDDDVLHLRATFEPLPLFKVLGKRGFAHESLAHAPDDWSVWFWQQSTADEPGVDVATPLPPSKAATAGDATTVYLDVRELDPPEPMTRTLAALETLPPGHTLVQVNRRVPQFLLPVLAERGFACEVDEAQPDRVLVRIWHAR